MFTTVQEVVIDAINKLSDKDTLRIRKTKKDVLIMYHHGFGTWIRNTYDLWSRNPELFESVGFDEDAHPDEVSFEIIKAIWKKLNGLK